MSTNSCQSEYVTCSPLPARGHNSQSLISAPAKTFNIFLPEPLNNNPKMAIIDNNKLKNLGKELSTPGYNLQEKPSSSAERGITYRNSIKCKRYFKKLHEFEGIEFGDDFKSKSNDFKHWFRADSFFCAASFSNKKILSVISMLFVTEESAINFINGNMVEQDLIPYEKKYSYSPPVIYFSSMVSQSPQDSVRLFRTLLKDIYFYINQNNVAPNWGFSIVISDKAKKYLINSGFYEIESKSFLNRYNMVKIDCKSAKSKLWSSILKEGPATSIDRIANEYVCMDSKEALLNPFLIHAQKNNYSQVH